MSIRATGSSPHARGTPQSFQLVPDFGRFIPACAGNANKCPGQRPEHAVHPRMRGERTIEDRGRARVIGSSPHARGTPVDARSRSCSRRFIPACAGNAQHGCIRRSTSPVHPRMRGERARAMPARASAIGSSPHARGTRADYRRCRSGRRFIPACAGNARRTACCPGSEPVHPRMRGERRAERGRTGSLGGSSPHARGTHDFRSGSLVSTRFIPACAGNACPSAWTRRGRPVHPRMRGERDCVRNWCAPVAGSSPHARGTPNNIRA